MVAEEGLTDQIEIDSAGTAAYHVGERADARSRDFAPRRGIALDSRGRQFTSADFEAFDFVLAMDASNLADLEQLPGATQYPGTLSLFRAFDPIAPAGAEVPDPYYGGDRGFDDVLDLCEAACRGLIEHLRETGRIS